MPTQAKARPEKLTAIRNYLQNFDYKNEKESINGFVELLKDIDIKMVVFDFDLTIIGAHSGGYIDKSNDIKNIGLAVTNHFKIFSKALYENGIKIAVATFS
ncbi:P36-like protein homologue, partial [Plasmodium malariae]